jgi:nucleoside-diphosphate-sugar epimerase
MIFVTGGTGLVGAHLLYELTSSGKQVKALKRETSDVNQVLKTFSYYTENPEILYNQIEWINGDILDYFFLENILKGVTEIFHCAAIISFNPKERKKMISNNVQGTSNLVNAALENGVQKFCHVSSIAALGNTLNGIPITEETNWVPSKKVTGYSESKFFSELEIWRGIEEGLDAVIVNPSIILGPTKWNSGSAQFFKMMNDEFKFYTRGIKGFVDVFDVVKAMVALMDEQHFENTKNQRFLLNAENWSMQDLFNKIADALEKPHPIYFTSDFILGVIWRVAKIVSLVSGKPPFLTRETAASSNKKNYYDGSKVKQFIDFEYTPIEETISRTSDFLKQDLKNQA